MAKRLHDLDHVIDRLHKLHSYLASRPDGFVVLRAMRHAKPKCALARAGLRFIPNEGGTAPPKFQRLRIASPRRLARNCGHPNEA